MQLDKLTLKSQETLQEAQRLARELSQQEMDGEHLLLALLSQAESLVPELLARIGVPPARLQPDLEKELARRHKIQGGGDPYAGRDLQKALDDAATRRRGRLRHMISRNPLFFKTTGEIIIAGTNQVTGVST
jgi:ATP-dependent Clp protease ATP-binding subunit ClpB